MPRRITLKYRIHGALFRRRYARTPQGTRAAMSRLGVLLCSGIAVVIHGMPPLTKENSQ